ncbi:MAG: ABC transporter permease [Anaerolineae bacterium]|nr:ABC transporter permease [Anaerolineae bacterium]
MNDSIWRKIIGDIRTRKGRTALVAASIFIGVLGVVTLITAGDLLVRQLTADIRQDELPMLVNFVVIPGDPPANLDDAATLKMLGELPGVTVVEGQANYPVFWKLPDETRFRETRVQAYTQPFDAVQLGPPRLVEGRWPREGQRELLVEVRLADDFELSVGDTLDVRILSDVENLPTESWTVSGLVFDAYSQQASQQLYATFNDARRMAGFVGMNIISARFTDYATAEQSLEAFGAAITDQTPYITFFQLSEDPAQNSAIEATKQYAAVLAALAIVAMLVSGFLVINVINNIVVEQKRQIGVMKSLGALRHETFMIYAGIALIYGMLGMVPGVILGIPLGYQMAVVIGDFAGTLINEFQVSPSGDCAGRRAGAGRARPLGGSARLQRHAGDHSRSHDRPGHLRRLQSGADCALYPRPAAARADQAVAEQHQPEEGADDADRRHTGPGGDRVHGRVGGLRAHQPGAQRHPRHVLFRGAGAAHAEPAL